jgi:hypothetical protein
VRVFLDYRGSVAPGQYGVAGPHDTQGVYGPVIDNLVDFLLRAAVRGIYTVVTLNRWPENDYFKSIFDQGQLPGIEGSNAFYLTPGGVAAHAELSRRVVQAVADRNSNALTWVLAWELDNEIQLVTNLLPFSQTSGTVTTGDGKTYDLSDSAQRLACMDSNFNHWVNESAAAIRAVDPQALVSVSVFTNMAVQRSGPGPTPCTLPCDVRAPPRPVALRQGTTLSYVDVHAYPVGNYSFAADLASSEVNTPEFFRTRQPWLMGEFGAFTDLFSTAQVAANVMLWHRQQATLAGATGALFWAWDTTDQPGLWGATEGNYAIYSKLTASILERTSAPQGGGRHGVHFAGFEQPDLSGDGIRMRVDRWLGHTGWTPLYLCDIDGQAVLHDARNCGVPTKVPGTKSPQLFWRGAIGSISPTAQPGTNAIYRCERTLPSAVVDRYISPDFLCEGGTKLGILGYAPDH